MVWLKTLLYIKHMLQRACRQKVRNDNFSHVFKSTHWLQIVGPLIFLSFGIQFCFRPHPGMCLRPYPWRWLWTGGHNVTGLWLTYGLWHGFCMQWSAFVKGNFKQYQNKEWFARASVISLGRLVCLLQVRFNSPGPRKHFLSRHSEI